MKRTWTFVIAVIAGCSNGTKVAPKAPAARAPAAEVLEVDHVEGIAIDAHTNAWPGDLAVLLYVTPVRMTLTNHTDRPIRVSYPLFQLVTPSGRRYSALPPFKIEGSPAEPAIMYPHEPFEPELAQHGFFVSRLYADHYPAIARWDRPFFYDLDYHDHYYSYWNTALPTQPMIEVALPEGVLDPGGQVTGYLYFERVGNAETVTLQGQVVDAESGTLVGTSAIAFDIRG